MLQREAETGILLTNLKLRAQILKRQTLFRQLGGLAQQQDHSAGGGTGIQHKNLFFRVLRQNQISRGHGGVIGAGKLRGDGHADGFLALLEGLGIGGGGGTGGRGTVMGQLAQQCRNIQLRRIQIVLTADVQAHGRYCQTGVRGIEFPGDQITAAVADKIQHDDTLLPRPTGC